MDYSNVEDTSLTSSKILYETHPIQPQPPRSRGAGTLPSATGTDCWGACVFRFCFCVFFFFFFSQT